MTIVLSLVAMTPMTGGDKPPFGGKVRAVDQDLARTAAMAPGMAKDDDPPFGREQEPAEPTDDENGRGNESEAEDMPPDDDAPSA